MINREKIPAVLLTYDDSLDEYGQPRKSIPDKREVEITEPKIYKHSPVEDVRFNDVEYLSLTLDKSIDDSNELIINEKRYRICFTIPQGRLNQLFLKEYDY